MEKNRSLINAGRYWQICEVKHGDKKMYAFLIKIFEKFGFEVVESIPASVENNSIRLFARHPSGFALKFRHRQIEQSGSDSSAPYHLQLFRIREDGGMARLLLVRNDTPFTIHDNISDVNSLKKFREILEQVSTGFYSGKGVLDTRRACEDLEGL